MSSTSAFVDSATPPAPRRRRAQIACRNCRRRKIKCVTNEEPPHNPCERCQRKGLVCEYVAVGDPSPPSTPLSDRSGLGDPVHLEPQAYPYGSANAPHLLVDPTTYSSHGYNPGVYQGYPSAGPQSNHTHLDSTRFPPGPPTAWPSSNLAHPSMLPNQTGPMSHNYAPDYHLASSNSHPSQWATQDHMRSRVSNAYGTPYYNPIPDSSSQHAGSYNTQYESSTLQCWCRAPTCICGGRR